jgi:hypothetical protein
MMMSEFLFPYTGWVLQPSMKPVKVTLVEEYRQWGDGLWHKNEKGKFYSLNEIHATKAGAIAAGRQKLVEMQAKIDKTAASIAKKRAELDKAERQ